MFDLFLKFGEDVVNESGQTAVEWLKEQIGSLFQSVFRIETWSVLDATVLSTLVVSRMLVALYGFMVLLLALKLIWKGFKVYVLWRDGESETSPVELLGGSVFALVTAMAFPLLYDIAVDIVMEIGDTLLQYTGWAVFDSDATDMVGFVNDLLVYISKNVSLMVIIMGLVFLITVLILYFKLLLKGVELLFFRLGIPFAAIGLVDSDGGSFKPYIQVFFKELATVLTQYVCLILGLLIVSSVTTPAMLLSIAFMITGISAPKILSQFTNPGGGGGLAQKITIASMVIRTFVAK